MTLHENASMKKIIPLHLVFIFSSFAFTVLYGQSKDLITFKGNVSFVSDAPLEVIKAASNQLTGIIKLADNSFAFAVPVRSFEGFNSPLQREHFNENYMESHLYEKVSYSGKILDNITWEKDGEYEVRTKGKLNAHGVETERILKHTVSIKNGIIKINSSFTVPLQDHNITIPRIVYKKIAEVIQITLSTTSTR
jgi:hypothetical protein